MSDSVRSAPPETGPATMDPEPFEALIENFGFYAIEVARLMRRCFDYDLAESGVNLSPGEARALSFVAAFPNERQKQLAERMGVEAMTLVGYVDSLAARGLVVRTVDASDRRANIISLTSQAGPVIGHIAAINRQVRDEATAQFAIDDLIVLEQLLIRLRDAFTSMEAQRRREGGLRSAATLRRAADRGAT